MAKKFLVPINLLRLNSNPATGTEGDVYFNTSSQELRVFSEGIWKSISYDISASVASLDYVDTQVDDIYDFIFDGLTTDDIYEGEYNLFLTPENVQTVAGPAINAASANALNEAIAYTDNELSDLNIFSTIVTNPETQTIIGDSNSDALTFIAGENISITAASASDSITISFPGFELDQLDDVTISNIQNEDILVYNSASSIWVNSNDLTNLKSQVSTIENNNNYYNAVVVNTNSPTVCDEWSVEEVTTLEYLIQIKQESKYQSQKMLAVTDGSIINYNNHAIISIGEPMLNLSITSSISSGIGRLFVQISDALNSNAEVKILRTKIS